MKKKIITAIVLCFSLMLTMVLTGCGVAEVESIEVIGNAYSEYIVGENYDYSNVKLHVTFNDGTEQTISATDPGVSVTGLDTSAATQNAKMVISYTDEKGNTASCELGYTVYTRAQTIAYTADRSKVVDQTANDDEGILFFSRAGKYDMTDYVISRNLKIVARTGENVILQNLKINPASDITVSLNNVTLTNEGQQKNVINVTSVATNNCNITINKCKLKANGVVENGLNVPVKGNIEVNETEFITENKQSDIFQYGLKFPTGRDLNDTVKITKNTIDCNFEYLFFNITKAEVIGNHIDATLTSTGLGEYTGVSHGQTAFVAKKNPVVFHYESGTVQAKAGQKYTFIVKNNTIKNAQNFIRAYGIDNRDFDNEIDWSFSGNTLDNIGVLLNGSSKTHVTIQKLLDIIKEDTNITATCYQQEYKSVIAQDTVIQVQKSGVYHEAIAATGADIYYDIANDGGIYMPATMTIGDNTYTYVGYATKMYGDTTKGYIILRDNTAYIITAMEYSPTGDILTFAGNTGSTKKIEEAKAYTIADIIEMLGITK